MNFKEFLNEKKIENNWLTPKEVDKVINFLRAENIYDIKPIKGFDGQFHVGPSRKLAEQVKELLLKKFKNIEITTLVRKRNYILDVQGKIQ